MLICMGYLPITSVNGFSTGFVFAHHKTVAGKGLWGSHHSSLMKSEVEAKKNKKKEQLQVTRSGVNEVYLEGCISSLPTTKVLPSGDEVVEFRIVIDRARRRGQKREVDSLEIAAWNAREKRQVQKLVPGQWIALEGSVHRRFWSSPKGLASRWQIEVSALQKL